MSHNDSNRLSQPVYELCVAATGRPRACTFAVILNFFSDTSQLLLSATSNDSYSQYMLMQLDDWKASANKGARKIMSSSLMWLAQMEREPHLLEGLTLDAAGYIEDERRKEKLTMEAKETAGFITIYKQLQRCKALLGHHSLSAVRDCVIARQAGTRGLLNVLLIFAQVTIPQRAALSAACVQIEAALARKNPEFHHQRHRFVGAPETLRIAAPELGVSVEEQVRSRGRNTRRYWLCLPTLCSVQVLAHTLQAFDQLKEVNVSMALPIVSSCSLWVVLPFC